MTYIVNKPSDEVLCAIDRVLTEVMDIAVLNGANSISMPDDYVLIAAWLCGIE